VARVKRFVEAHHVSYPVIAVDQHVADIFGQPDLLPTSILYGPDGHVKQTFQGSISEEELTAAIAAP
jgi:hypothetical protein